ncbi:MAG: hypothetical protein KA768_10760 [Desulfobulbus sp.]|uniref:hypothetical protein n=1 Tax=uncultured Desulfobulbus sp. TaxID=239745 RepID=UPI001B63E2C9|nr:hypothetical protein [uncultured Desulfobulbus sp.]MBP7518303.1 hypothetical protein [Desulfobulbus sp.]
MTSMIPQSLVALADIRPRAIDDWAQYRLEGEQFLRLAEQAHHRQKKAFTPTILYNLVTMAIEKLVMAALMRCGRLPDNHTLHDLVAALERWLPETVRGLAGPLCELDSFQDICDPYAGTITAPSRREVESMLILARKLEERLAMGTVVPPKEHRERP